MDENIRRTTPLALTDVWYGKELPDITEALSTRLSPGWFGLVSRSRLTRALALVWAGRRDPLLLTCWAESGLGLTVLCGLLGQRKLVILEFIDYDHQSRHALVSSAYRAIIKYILGPCGRRSILNVQVLTEWEKDHVVRNYGLEPSRVRVLHWPLLLGEIEGRPLGMSPEKPMVFSSGRAACDWETLFAAFRLGDWPLTVVCTARDLPRIQALNADHKATVHTDIPKDEHDRLFASATVYALCLKEKQKSSGQVRLASSIEAGVPVVASNVRGLIGYLVDGVTAAAVPPGDAQALSTAIGQLMNSAEARRQLVTAAQTFARGNTREIYMDRIARMLAESNAEAGAPSPVRL
jgi:glycosyltransferase involved in cell wall biosynthesis